MGHVDRALAPLAILLIAGAGACSSDTGSGESHESGSLTAARGEHDREGGEHGDASGEHGREGGGEHGEEGYGEHGEEADREGGEESGTELALNETYDAVRNGVRLVLTYDAQGNSFEGTVENTTDKILRRVRVEVHLSNGRELGPTTPVDLEPGAKKEVELAAIGSGFDGWSAHPEVGSGEHG